MVSGKSSAWNDRYQSSLMFGKALPDGISNRDWQLALLRAARPPGRHSRKGLNRRESLGF